jgi:hypothetical protein
MRKNLHLKHYFQDFVQKNRSKDDKEVINEIILMPSASKELEVLQIMIAMIYLYYIEIRSMNRYLAIAILITGFLTTVTHP